MNKKLTAGAAVAVALAGAVTAVVLTRRDTSMDLSPDQQALTDRLHAVKKRCAGLPDAERDACEVTRLGMVRARYLLGSDGPRVLRHCFDGASDPKIEHPLYRTICDARNRVPEKRRTELLGDLELAVDGGAP